MTKIRKHNAAVVDRSMRALADSVTSILADDDIDKATAMAKTFVQFASYLKANVVTDGADDADTIDDDTDDTSELPPQLEQLASALVAVHPNLSRQEAVHYLIHTAHGRAMIDRLSKREDTSTMDRADELRKIAKDYGIAKVAEHIVSKGETAVTEHELTEMTMEYAKAHKIANETDAAAFARVYSANGPEGIQLRKAFQISKATLAPLMSLEPVVVGGNDALDVNDAKKAYQALTDLAEAQIKRSPTLSPAQAFARVFEDPANAALASRAHRRPTATTNYAYPYQQTV